MLPDPSDNDDPVPGSLVDAIYAQAVAEYHHQIDYNWTRTQYLLALNAAILAAGSAIATRGTFAVLVFGLGVAVAGVSAAFTKLVRPLYQQARDRLRRVEEKVGVPVGVRFDTTPTLGAPRQRSKAHWLVYWLFAIMGLADAVGLLAVAVRGK